MQFQLTVLHESTMAFFFSDSELSAVALMFYSWLNNRKPDATEFMKWSEAITELMRDAMTDDEPPSVTVGNFEIFMKVSVDLFRR